MNTSRGETAVCFRNRRKVRFNKRGSAQRDRDVVASLNRSMFTAHHLCTGGDMAHNLWSTADTSSTPNIIFINFLISWWSFHFLSASKMQQIERVSTLHGPLNTSREKSPSRRSRDHGEHQGAWGHDGHEKFRKPWDRRWYIFIIYIVIYSYILSILYINIYI